MQRSSWWVSKIRQFRDHLRARVGAEERAALAGWLTPAQLALYDGMHVADRRHGLAVVAALRAAGVGEGDVLLAGLLHDSGKGHAGVWPRVVHSLSQRYGRRVGRAARLLPGLGRSLDRLRDHPARSARLAEAAGCPPRTVGLIRHQEAPLDPEFGECLRLADEAS